MVNYSDVSAQIIGLDLLGRQNSVSIPFDYEQGFILVDVWIEGIIPLKMIFDTGAENTVLFDREIAQILKIPYERQIPLIGSDLDSVIIANIARNVRMRMTNCRRVRRDIVVLQDNNLLLKEKLGIDVNGIIGGSFFSNTVIKIDYKKRRITITKPSNFIIPKKRLWKVRFGDWIKQTLCARDGGQCWQSDWSKTIIGHGGFPTLPSPYQYGYYFKITWSSNGR